MQKVIMYKASIITPIMISNGNLRKQQISQIWNKLSELELGQSHQQFNQGNKKNVQCFTKIKSEILLQRPDIGQTIQDIGLNLDLVVKGGV